MNGINDNYYGNLLIYMYDVDTASVALLFPSIVTGKTPYVTYVI